MTSTTITRNRIGMLAAMAVASAAVVTACSAGTPAASPSRSIASVNQAPSEGPGTVQPTTATPAATASAASLPALKLLWESSGPTQPTPCCQTWWPAIEPRTGNIWVANSFGNEYWIFKPDGKFVEAWGKPGKGDGEFDFSMHRPQPQASGAIAFAPDGSFYVADIGNRRVQKFSAARKYLLQWGSFGAGDGQFAEPSGIATDGTTVYVVDDDRGDIQAFDGRGKFLRTEGEITTNAGIFMALDAAGNLYRAGEAPTSYAKYDPTGKLLGHIEIRTGDGGYVIGPAVAPDRRLFALIGYDDRPGGLVELDAAGTELRRWSTGGQTAVVDPTGTAIYVASEGNDEWPTASLRKYALPGN